MKSKTAIFDIISTFCANEYKVTTQITQYRGHATELAREAGEEYDLCVCCGGDGTLNETISGLMTSDKKIPLGYIPCGTTNDFANSMGISTNPIKATENIINSEVIDIDVGQFKDRFFTYIASFGAFTATSYNTPQESKNAFGHLAYLLSGIKDLSSLRPYEITYTTANETVKDEYIFGAVSNSTSVGGIVKLNPDLVDVKDGLFEVVLIRSPKNPVDLSKIIHGITVSDFSNDMFRFLKVPEIKFTMDELIPWTLDGEYCEGSTEVFAKVCKQAISIKK